MVLRNRYLNQNGFTLLSTMAAVGIAAVIILGLGSVLTQMFRVLRGAEITANSADIMSQIRMNFENPDMCDSALAGHSFKANPPGAAVSLSGASLLMGGQPTSFSVGAEVQPGTGLVLKSMDLLTLTKFGEREEIALKSGSTAYRYQGLIRVQMARRVAGQSVDQAPSFIPVSFTTTSGGATGTISGCGVGAISQATCESLNYVWDTATKKCIQANECSYGGSYADTAGGAVGSFTNPFTGGYSCPADAEGIPYDPIRSGSISWAVKSGKYGVSSHVYPVFSCMICKDARGNKTPFSATTLMAINNLADVTGEDPPAAPSTCASKTGGGPGYATFSCRCGGTASCTDAMYIGWPVGYIPAICSESCPDGHTFWLQFFNYDGTPSGAAFNYSY